MAKLMTIASYTVLVLTALCMRAETAPVPLRSQVGIRAYISYYEIAGLDSADVDVESQGDALNPLSSVASVALNSGNVTASCSGHVEASWAGIASGSVHIYQRLLRSSNMGLNPGVELEIRGACAPFIHYYGTAAWVYEFVADANGEFRLSYAASAENPNEQYTYYVTFNNEIFTITGVGAGNVSFLFSQGQSCTVQLTPYGLNISGSGNAIDKWSDLSCSWSFDTAPVTAVGDDASALPKATTIAAIYPNPFNPRTTIAFELAEAGAIELAIYDVGGRLVRVMDSGSRAAGRYQSTWDGQDNDGRAVPTGTYFCRLSTAQGSQTKKMTLAR